MEPKNHYVYILQSLKTSSYYVGSTQNIGRRFKKHQLGHSLATRGHRPWVLIHVEEFENKTQALVRENEIKKKKSKAYIQSILSST